MEGVRGKNEESCTVGNRTWTGGMRGARRKVECWEGGFTPGEMNSLLNFLRYLS